VVCAGVLSDSASREFWLTKSSVFVGVAERGCFLEEEWKQKPPIEIVIWLVRCN
jgi:hypothetical protein